MKRLKAFLAALLLSVAGIMSLNVGQVFAATCTWTGASSDNFNTAGNWSGCGGGVPQNGDSITFDVTSLSTSKTLTNNISSLSVATITFTGTNANSYYYTIEGSALSITGGIVANARASMAVDVTLGATQTWSGSSDILLGDFDTPKTLAMGAYNLTVNAQTGFSSYSVLTGSGDLIVSKDAWMMKSSPSWTGDVSIGAEAQTAIEKADAFGSTGTVTIANGGRLDLCGLNGATVQNPISVAGDAGGLGAVRAYASCGGPGDAAVGKAVLAGAITLTGDTVVDSVNELKITGPLSGNYTITLKSGAQGSLVIASSNNTSKTPNGTAEAKIETITVEDSQPNTFVTVGKNQIYIINGVRGITTVQVGGTLKGTGTVGDLTVSGKVAPGLSPGCLTTGALSFLPTGVYEVEIGGTTACSGYDQMKVTGTVQVDGTLSVSTFGTFKPAKGQIYTVIDNDGSDAVVGTFASLAEGATFTSGGYVYKISYVGGSGNDVTLTVMNVPASPDTGFAMLQANPLTSVLAMVAAGGALIFLARRMKPAKATARRR